MDLARKIFILSSFSLLIIAEVYARSKNCNGNGICIKNESKDVYIIRTLKNHTFQCRGRVLNKSTFHNDSLSIRWTIEPRKLLLAQWNETLERNGSVIKTIRGSLESPYNVGFAEFTGQHFSSRDDISWCITIADLEPEIFGRIRCHVNNVGSALIYVRHAIVPTFTHILGTDPTNADDRASRDVRSELRSAHQKRTSISCLTNGDPMPTVTWALNGKELNSVNTTISETLSNKVYRVWVSTISIVLDKAQNGAIISCSAKIKTEDGESKSISNKAILHIAYIPRNVEIIPTMGFKQELDNSVLEGTGIEMTCKSDCSSFCTYDWYHQEKTKQEEKPAMNSKSDADGRGSKAGLGKLVNTGKAVLQWKVVDRDKDGRYRCVVTSENGWLASKTFHLRIVYPPSQPTIEMTQTNETLILKCNTSDLGKPRATILWTLESMEDNITVESEGAQIEADFSKRGQMSRATCTVRNAAGQKSMTTYFVLKIKTKIKINTITKEPSLDAVLDCDPANSTQHQNTSTSTRLFCCYTSGRQEENSSSFNGTMKLPIYIRMVNPVKEQEPEEGEMGEEKIMPLEKRKTTTLHINPTEKMETSTLHINPTEKMEASTLHINPTEKIENSTLHINPTEKMETSTLHINPTEKMETSTSKIDPMVNTEEKEMKKMARAMVEKVKMPSRSNTEITAAIVIVGMLVVAGLLAIAMRCSIPLESKEGKSAQEEPMEGEETIMTITRARNLDASEQSQIRSISVDVEGTVNNNNIDEGGAVEKREEDNDINGPKNEGKTANMTRSYSEVTRSPMLPPREEDETCDAASVTSLEINKSCEILGDYVNDVNALFNIIDDLTRNMDIDELQGVEKELTELQEEIEADKITIQTSDAIIEIEKEQNC